MRSPLQGYRQPARIKTDSIPEGTGPYIECTTGRTMTTAQDRLAAGPHHRRRASSFSSTTRAGPRSPTHRPGRDEQPMTFEVNIVPANRWATSNYPVARDWPEWRFLSIADGTRPNSRQVQLLGVGSTCSYAGCLASPMPHGYGPQAWEHLFLPYSSRDLDYRTRHAASDRRQKSDLCPSP